MEEKLEQQVTRGLSSQNAQKSYPFPTEAISLPSKGLCYPEGSPLAKGEITIKLILNEKIKKGEDKLDVTFELVYQIDEETN